MRWKPPLTATGRGRSSSASAGSSAVACGRFVHTGPLCLSSCFVGGVLGERARQLHCRLAATKPFLPVLPVQDTPTLTLTLTQP